MLKRILFAISFLLTTTAFAEDFDYSYVSVSYQGVDADYDLFVDGSRFSINASLELNDEWFAIAEYGTAEFDVPVDRNNYSLGLGYRLGIGAQTDLVPTLAWAHSEIDPEGFSSIDDDGVAVSLGLRHAFTDRFELFGFFEYADLFESADKVIGLDALYQLNEAIAIGVNASVADGATIKSSYGIEVRYYFGQ